MTTDDQPAMERHLNHVLVIEDEEGHAELIRRGFKSNQQDFHLTFAGSLLDARNRINKNPPDLIIADWLLPDGKGIEILPSDREAITIPVIIMTSHGNEDLAVEMLKAGVVDYIVKSESSFKELPHIAERALWDWGNIVQRKRAEAALHESEERYRILTDAAHDAIYTLSPEGVVTYVNSGGSALIGMPPEKIVGLSLKSLYHPDIAQEFRENLDKVISTKRPVRYDSKFWHENQDQITWLDAQLVPQFGPDGSVVQVIGISRSITDRKQAEMLLKRFNEELEWQVRLRTAELEHTNTLLEAEIIQRTLAEENVRKSLNERELLLREIHHRVKNNLQIILSLISLQSRNIQDQKLLDTMGEFQNRIMAMAHIHERMYRAEDISRIDLSEIVTFLGSSLFKFYKVNPKVIRLNVEFKDIQISINSAIPISLIINELISNSIKHGFPKGTLGEITIAGRREADTIVLSIKDTGIGIPKDLDWKRSKQSLGLRLVVSLVEQLNGTIELDRSAGTAFIIVVQEKIS
jgi:PAS domain S-box-containing protein